MRRRRFLQTTGAALTAGALAGRTRAAGTDSTVPPIEFYSTATLLDSNYGALTDESVILTWAAKTASQSDSDGNGDAYFYPDGTPIPLAAKDGTVAGFGSILTADGDVNFEYGNEEFLVNVIDGDLGGSGTILWDESHNQYWTQSRCSNFASYLESNGYTVRSTSDLSADLPDADGVIVTSPGNFSDSELQDVADFVGGGGGLYLFDQSDYNDYDETENLNDIAGYLSLAFRFNDDEVTDTENNAGEDYQPLTDEFNTSFAVFDERDGLGLEQGETFEVTVTSVTDGDTFDVEFPDGTTEEVRLLGIDTPETPRNSSAESIEEWEGIEDGKYLEDQGKAASDFATNELDGKTVDLFFDSAEPVRDIFGRLLGYVRYDATGDGSRNTLYNRKAVADGYARVYDSTFTKHDDFLAAETDARANGRQVWSRSDPQNTSEVRDRDVAEVFVPTTSSVRTTNGAIADSRVPVSAESTATQTLEGGVSYDQIPLVGVDESVNTALIGGPLIDEQYDADTSDLEQFVFLTNLIDYLGGNSGDVLIDGGHGQFGHEYSLSAEDAVYYLRYLEGQGIGFQGVNAITDTNLSGARALIVTAPTCAYTQSELDAVSTFVSNGGSLILVGTSRTEDVFDAPRGFLDDVAAGVGSDLRLNEDFVEDDTNNVNNNPELLTTAVFDTSFPLFDPYS